MHPLDGAYERVNRAREHLVDLKRRVDLIRQNKKYSILSEHKSTLSQLPVYKKRYGISGVTIHSGSPEPIISILTGEVIYNLRAALDYLVYELACFDTKQIIEDTQFIIEDKPEDFLRNSKRRLRGLNPKHVTAIKILQPCEGCQWTGNLRDISNPDKHRRLTITNAPARVTLSGYAEAIALELPVNMNYRVSIQVVFADGTPVIETLEQLVLQVTKTLRDFEPEFQ